MTVIKRELQRGLDLSEKVMMGKRPWSDLFVKHTFFTSGYKYYISVISASKTKENHKIWSGYVESKVRMLVQKLEQHPSIALAHAFNKGYDRRHRCHNDQEIQQVQDGSLEFLIPESTKEESAIQSDPEGKPIIKPDVENEVAIKPDPENEVAIKPIPDNEAAIKPDPDAEPEVKPEAVKEEEEEKPKDASVNDVYTTTHYIGLELAEGMFRLRRRLQLVFIQPLFLRLF